MAVVSSIKEEKGFKAALFSAALGDLAVIMMLPLFSWERSLAAYTRTVPKDSGPLAEKSLPLNVPGIKPGDVLFLCRIWYLCDEKGAVKVFLSEGTPVLYLEVFIPDELFKLTTRSFGVDPDANIYLKVLYGENTGIITLQHLTRTIASAAK